MTRRRGRRARRQRPSLSLSHTGSVEKQRASRPSKSPRGATWQCEPLADASGSDTTPQAATRRSEPAPVLQTELDSEAHQIHYDSDHYAIGRSLERSASTLVNPSCTATNTSRAASCALRAPRAIGRALNSLRGTVTQGVIQYFSAAGALAPPGDGQGPEEAVTVAQRKGWMLVASDFPVR